MRGWSAVGVVAVLVGMSGGGGSVGAVEPDEARPAALESPVESGSRGGFAEVASVMYAEPVLAVESLRIEALVFVESGDGKHLKFVQCPLFIVERDAPKTTITVDCEARKSALGKQAYLDVSVSDPNANSGNACLTAARDLRRNQRFSCSVTDPRTMESAT
jgi:hypothetical protein